MLQQDIHYKYAYSYGGIVTEVCCHKINMNTKEKDIIERILNFDSEKLFMETLWDHLKSLIIIMINH